MSRNFLTSIVLPAGTASNAPLSLQSGTNLTTAAAGAIEYDGKVIYSTPAGRGVSPSMMFYRLDSALAGSNVTTAQNIFGVGVTLQSSTVYAFEMVATFTKTAGTTSHFFYIAFDGGTATFNNFFANNLCAAMQGAPSTNTNFSLGNVYIGTTNTAAEVSYLSGIAGATRTLPFFFSGTFSISSGGTFLPKYRMSTAPGGAYSTMIGSYICIWPIGASGANTSVGPWA